MALWCVGLLIYAGISLYLATPSYIIIYLLGSLIGWVAAKWF